MNYDDTCPRAGLNLQPCWSEASTLPLRHGGRLVHSECLVYKAYGLVKYVYNLGCHISIRCTIDFISSISNNVHINRMISKVNQAEKKYNKIRKQ